ncbi:MAG: outer membrane beta-barrel protein [Kordiimonadaceae bacterium]|nr:outer membrane beta-barrel protein [Kordiimonadaceae bacterium]MBO6570117.1 outer membrane beta-barrel protein [Kordiimonadaceae bacterium]MBO6965785.1 outer membrane beta-barrel protein [Kordiimonadaceae bacterium]
MKFQSIAALAAPFALLFSGSAFAQDASEEDKHFQGVYGGITAGYGDFSSGGDGANVDFFLGGRLQSDNGLVYGIEGVLGISDSESREPFLDLFDGYNSVIGKIGYTPDNRVMWYGGVGYTSVDVVNELVNLDRADGVVFEAGVEYMPSSWFGLRLRGQYHTASNEADITNVGAGLFFSF